MAPTRPEISASMRYIVSGEDLLHRTHVDRAYEGSLNRFVSGIREDIDRDDKSFQRTRDVVRGTVRRYVPLHLSFVSLPVEKYLQEHLKKRFDQLQDLRTTPQVAVTEDADARDVDAQDAEKSQALQTLLATEEQVLTAVAHHQQPLSDQAEAHDDADDEASSVTGAQADESAKESSSSSLTVQAIRLKFEHRQFEVLNNDRPMAAIRHANHAQHQLMAEHLVQDGAALVRTARKECPVLMSAACVLPGKIVGKVAQRVADSVFSFQNDALADALQARATHHNLPAREQAEIRGCLQAMRHADQALEDVRADAVALVHVLKSGKAEQAQPGHDWYQASSQHLRAYQQAVAREEKAWSRLGAE